MNSENIFSREHFVPYFIKLFYVLLFVFIAESIIVSLNYYEYHKKNGNRVTDIINTEGVDLNLLCNITNCVKIEYDGMLYIKNKETKILEHVGPKIYSETVCNAGIIYHEENGMKIYSDISQYLYSVIVQYITLILLTIMLFTWYYIKSIVSDRNTSSLKLYIDKFKLEGKLQNVVAESAYHEMMTPVAAIKTAMLEIIADSTSPYHVPCSKCPVEEVKKVYGIHSDIIIDNIERLESVMQQMSTSKYIKSASRHRTVYSLIKSANESLQIFHINSKFTFEIHNEDIMNEYVLDKLNNGTMMNILNNQIKNALEAGATKIVFGIKKSRTSNKLNVIITDNGTGIPDLEDTKDYDQIFKLGFSSKDKEETLSSNIKKVGLIKGICNSIWDELFGKHDNHVKKLMDESKSHRGFGLYVSREIMRHDGGDIKVIETSKKGTVFMLTFIGRKLK